MNYQRYRKTATTEMTPWTSDADMEGVSIGDDDKSNGSPKEGDMIARDPNNNSDRWLVNAAYFEANYNPDPVTE